MKVWHKVPTSDQLERMKWLPAMRQDPTYPSDESFYICDLHFQDDCFERDLMVRVITQSTVFLKIDLPKN